ncbi:MAG: hypothetical protein AAFY82_01250 [Pseudomonadota bacterium]
MRISLMLCAAALVLGACHRVNPISEEERIEIDCLSSIAVVEITDYISAGADAGTDPADLMHIVPDKIAEAEEKLKGRYGGEMDSAFLEYEINHRLGQFESAIESGDPESLDYIRMTETLELGRSCTFGT